MRNHQTIREAVPEDVPAVVTFGREITEDAYVKTGFLPATYVSGPLRHYWSSPYLTQVIRSEESIVLLAFDRETLIGVVEFEVLNEAEAIMWKLYVHGSCQGKGIGSSLMESAIDRLPSTVRKLKTEYYDANLPAAAFYKSRGFTFEARREEEFEGQSIPYSFVSTQVSGREP